ncbi:potassium channel family protein [Bacillus testis]|uniref:potassium channel family protein n=1 Tax=Bacillus testis TaxID=1622072 RepID=UPI00067EC4DC|nr:potassium channel family protein [Bacillus testis]
MVSFILTAKRFLKSFFSSMQYKAFRRLFYTLVLVLLSGTLFYHEAEGMTLFDAFYFSIMTITTVGDPHLSPQTVYGKSFTILYVCVGIGLIFTFIAYLAKSIIKHEEDVHLKKENRQ